VKIAGLRQGLHGPLVFVRHCPQENGLAHAADARRGRADALCEDPAMVRAAIAPRALDAVRARAPREAEVVALEKGLDLSEVEFLVPPAGDRSILPVLPGLERLAVVQVLSAGTDWIEGSVPPQAALCSARGARDAPVSEWILGALLGASTGLLACARERRWRRGELDDLGAWTVIVLGMGSIGRMLGSRLGVLGTKVIGVGSHAHGGLHGVDELPQLLPRADAVVVLTPLTDSTRGLVDATVLAAMKDGAVLVNAARGPIVDTNALLAEVASGRLRAVLDVTDPEPLPDDHPLWSAPGVLAITPHIAGDSPVGHARAAALAGDQLARWWAGEELLNVVRRPMAP
jgi:phosphoglycerate dehydrogenase-like enzyme